MYYINIYIYITYITYIYIYICYVGYLAQRVTNRHLGLISAPPLVVCFPPNDICHY